MKAIKLYKPIIIDGKEVKEIAPDFENLASNAIARAQNFMLKQQYQVINPSNDIEMHSILCGMAAGLTPEEVFGMHPKNKFVMAFESVNFFGSDSEESQGENSSGS